MTEELLLIFLLSFLATFLLVKFLIRKMYFVKKDLGWDVGYWVPDLARKGKPLIPRLGGLAILAGFSFAVLISIRIIKPVHFVDMFAVLVMILAVGIMAFFSDVVKTSDKLRTVIPLLASIPLIAISAGVTTIRIPFIGPIDFGIYYALILIPIAVTACSNVFNMLAGHNGLEAGTGLVAASAILGALILRNSIIFPFIVPAILLTALIGACLAFLYFNWYPARIFPGDTGTYVIGAVIAGAVIVGNIELVGVIALMPQIIEFFLKLRGWFRAENFGKLRKGRLHYDGKIYSLTHIVMKYVKPTEKQLTLILIGFQALWGVIAVSSLYW